MWVIPGIGEKLIVSDKFVKEFKIYRGRIRERALPTQYDKCKEDNGWTVEYVREHNKEDVLIKFSEYESAFQLSRETGSFFAFRSGPCVFVTCNQGDISCPICGSPGIDLVFSLYCSNSKCQNYR